MSVCCCFQFQSHEFFFSCLSLPRQETDVRAGKTNPGLNFEIMSQYESSHVPWTLPSSTFPALHFIVFVAHNNNHKVERTKYQVSIEVSMEVYNSAMTELLPQAIKIGLVYDRVYEKGEEVLNELHHRALTLYDHVKEKAHSTIKDVNAIAVPPIRNVKSGLLANRGLQIGCKQIGVSF